MMTADRDFFACVNAINAGGVVVHATEGVFGLACGVDHPAAVERISNLKGRDPNASPFLVLVGDLQQVSGLVSLEVPFLEEIEASWPGAVTWIFPEKSINYPWLGGVDGSLGVRMTAHAQARDLALAAGPLVSTSANRHGDPAALSIDAAQQYFGSSVECYLDGSLLTPGQPSQIRHASTGARLR